jgi:hypothetical protein
MEKEDPTLDDVSPLHKKISEQEPSNMDVDEEDVEEEPEELSLDSILNGLIKKQNLIGIMIENLNKYCDAVVAKIQQDPLILNVERPKLYIVNRKHPHSTEIMARLLYIEFFVDKSSSKLSVENLRAIFDIISKTGIKADITDFYAWCKSAFETQAYFAKIIELEDLGALFQVLMQDKLLDLSSLPLIGFDLIAEYWMKVNDQVNNIKKKYKRVKIEEKVYAWQKDTEYNKVQEDDTDEPPFSVWRDPANLLQVELIEAIVLQSEVPDVYNKAIKFLIYMYTALEKDM